MQKLKTNYGKIKIFHGITYKIHIIPLWINESKVILLDKYVYSCYTKLNFDYYISILSSVASERPWKLYCKI